MKKFNVYRVIRGQKPMLVVSFDTFDAAYEYVGNKWPLVIDRMEKIAEGYWVLLFHCGNSIRIREVSENEKQKK